jgi:glycosyltransferase involved in cell wall biosynthesis
MCFKKVSVITPVYNLEKYIGECLESLISQETDFDYEIIAVDDGSIDNSYSLMKEIEKRHKYVLSVYRNEENQGLAKTMRRLIGYASGEYIAYLDGDDLALPGKLQVQADYLDDNRQCTIVYHESDVFDSRTEKTIRNYTKDYYNYQYIPQKATLKHVIKYGCFMQASTVMIRRHNHMVDAVDSCNKILLDHPWHVLNLVYGGGSIDFIDEVLGRYRIHENSFGAKTLRHSNRREQVLNDQLHVCELARQYGVSDEVVNEGIDHYYFATAMYFLKISDYERFFKYIKMSTDGVKFFDCRHKEMWLKANEPTCLKKKYFDS